MNPPDEIMLPIGAVERETGLSKDVLRVWERRYNFPAPARDAQGDRIYPAAQVQRLLLIKRLMDAGHRPGRVIRLTEAELEQFLEQDATTKPADSRIASLLALLHADSPAELDRHLQQCLATEGLQTFVTRTLPRMNEAVGDAWMQGDISVFEEHLYTEQVQNLVRHALQNLPAPSAARPRIVLTTLPGEQHSLGLLMVHSLLALAGADVRSFGIQMPLTEIAAATARQRADVVALSFSAAFPAASALESLGSLREMLPKTVQIWVGGKGLRTIRHLPAGVQRTEPLEKLQTLVTESHSSGIP